MPFLYPVSDYAALREESYRNAQARVTNPHVRIGAITYPDVTTAARWPTIAYWEGREDWTWFDLWSHYRTSYVRRFEVCLKFAGIVCGFGIGRPSKRKTQLGLDFIQGNPDPKHPLKGEVLPLVLLAAHEYGLLIGAVDLRIYNPDPDLIAHYARFGLHYVNKSVGMRGANYLTVQLKGMG